MIHGFRAHERVDRGTLARRPRVVRSGDLGGLFLGDLHARGRLVGGLVVGHVDPHRRLAARVTPVELHALARIELLSRHERVGDRCGRHPRSRDGSDTSATPAAPAASAYPDAPASTDGPATASAPDSAKTNSPA